MLHESKLLSKLEERFRPPQIFTLYGDPAYPLRPHLLAPYRGAMVTRDQQSFNKSMSKVRVSVEWTFGKVVQYFAFLDFKKNLKVLLQPIGMYYVVGAILTNCHTCLYGSTTSRFFNVAPPDLQNYLGH
jgi:hypothetical protein